MKKVLFLLISFSFAFLFDLTCVDATALSNKNYNLECIYSDGSLFTYEYSEGKSDYITNRLSYNLSGSSNRDANIGGDIVIVNYLPQKLPITNGVHDTSLVLTCDNIVRYAAYENNTYYKFGIVGFVCSEDKCSDFGAENSGWCKFVGCTSKDVKNAAAAAKAGNSQVYPLVSERFILGNNAEEPNATLYYMLPAEQASGVNAYIKILVYDNVVLLEKDGRVTKLDGTLAANEFSQVKYGPHKDENGNITGYGNNGLQTTTIFINSPEPNPVTNSSSSISYSFNKDQIRYSAKANRDEKTGHINKYTYTPDDPDGNKVDNSLCTERLKNTSPILKNIIKYMQILIPALVLVITSVDIAKVAVSGNIEEELPKRKKLIIHRLIIMVIFFFLPMFVKLSIKLIKDAGIGENNAISNGIEYIDCLFE